MLRAPCRLHARWLLRYLEERSRVTIDEAAMVATCLAALGGDRHEEAFPDASASRRSVVAELALGAGRAEEREFGRLAVSQIGGPALVVSR